MCVSVLRNDKVVIAGGASQTDGKSYGATLLGRRSILVMTPAANPNASTFHLSPHPIPSGVNFGGLFCDGGRNQVPCWRLSGARILIAGGQDNVGEDLWDSYVFNARTFAVHRAVDLPHVTAPWLADHPELGYPADYQIPLISTQSVNMRSSRLVFGNHVLVNGGGYDPLDFDSFHGVRSVEQSGSGCGQR